MQFASIREFRLNASMILGRTRNEESLIVTRRGKPVAILIPATSDTIEEVLRAVEGAKLKGAVERARKEAAQAGARRLTKKEINAEIAGSRKSLHA